MVKDKTLSAIDTKGDSFQKLKALASKLAKSIDDCVDDKNLPALARQYRETIKDLKDLAQVEDDDEISKLQNR